MATSRGGRHRFDPTVPDTVRSPELERFLPDHRETGAGLRAEHRHPAPGPAKRLVDGHRTERRAVRARVIVTVPGPHALALLVDDVEPRLVGLRGKGDRV